MRFASYEVFFQKRFQGTNIMLYDPPDDDGVDGRVAVNKNVSKSNHARKLGQSGCKFGMQLSEPITRLPDDFELPLNGGL